MKKALLILPFLFILFVASDNPNVLPESVYPYWPSYQYLDIEDLDTIEAQKWIKHDHVVQGWDWSLPEFVDPSPRSLVGLQRNIGWNKEYIPLNLKFKSNSVGILWVKWRDIEPTKGNYNFQPIIDRINQANNVGSDIILRILCHSKLRAGDIGKGDAPLWLEDLGVNLLPQEEERHNLNFDPSHPEFHKHYLMLVNELAKTGIPDMVKAAYVGYASHSFGDEGIGPHGENNPQANDAEEHVRERLDAWGDAFEGQEQKVFMGGTSYYGFEKGFGVRRGFVEMYLYHIPSPNLGQYVDEEGYLFVDEDAPILKYECFNGDVNEEYEKAWATDARSFRFGNTTNSYPYRYFTSTLRALQMRCTYIHTTGHLMPKMLPFLSQELGRSVEDAPDVWTFLRTSYIKASTYRNNDDMGREITTTEEEEGIETKNFERWLYQRDAPGFETEPAVKIQHAIKMWMVQDNKYYDYIARSGNKIGFDVDDRWKGIKDSLAIKVTYFDNFQGTLNLIYNNGETEVQKEQNLMGDSLLRTATFFISKIEANSLEHEFDFVLKAGDGAEKITVSMVRVVHADETSGQLAVREEVFPEDAWGVYSWVNYDPNKVSREKCPNIKGSPIILRWSNLEPENGKFEFKKEIGDKLELLDQNDFNTFLMVWVAFATSQVSETDTSWAFTPKWLFKNGVPLVEMEETINPLGVKTRRDSPYYFDDDYKFFFHRMIDSLGNYICNLLPHLKKRILFLQSAEGSTGDGQPYKGSPVNPIYNITKEQWSKFRIETWQKYKSAFTKDGELQLPLLTNYDSNEEEQYRWMLDSLPKALGLKNGMFSHGYHISDAQERLANFNAFRNEVEATGKTFFARGEQDAEYRTYGWSTQNIKQALYWSAIYATHCGLSMWNVPTDACQGQTYADAINFFNKYAAETKPNTAKGAFCALRRGLDASDTDAFPENIYGKAEKSNTQRYIDIAKALSDFGANQGDPEKAIGGGMVNRKRQDYNDVGWKILKGNYQRHITQIEPEETSVAWWQIDTSVYGRFARGFDAANGKDSMFFDLDDQFYGSGFLNGKEEVVIEIIYLDDDSGKWKLVYDAGEDSMKTAFEIINSGSGGWKAKSIILEDAFFANGGIRNTDFILVNTGNTNCRFHMIRIDKKGELEFPDETTSRYTYQSNSWQFPGDSIMAWQYDYILRNEGEATFALDSGKTIGIYGCQDNSGTNVRSYVDDLQFSDGAQFKWDEASQTFKKNGQWIEYLATFNSQEPYQLVIRTRKNVNANVKLSIYDMQGNTAFFGDFNLLSDFTVLDEANDQTNWLISKFPLKDLWGAYVIRFDWYDNVGEPGIFGAFSFVESTLDVIPPEWYFVSIGNVTVGSDIIVMTTEAAKVYLVPEGTAADTSSIINAAQASLEVEAYSQGFLSTTEITAGNYVVYAIDDANNISNPSRLISLQYPVLGRDLSFENDIVVLYDSTYQTINIHSSQELDQVDLYDILGKKIACKSCHGKVFKLKTENLYQGMYLVQVSDITGNIKRVKIRIA